MQLIENEIFYRLSFCLEIVVFKIKNGRRKMKKLKQIQLTKRRNFYIIYKIY